MTLEEKIALCSGQAGAEAAIALLAGEENPSGKLAESWPYRYEDCPSASYYSNGNRDAEYREGIFVGYRYYDTAEVPVRWGFGHGLSYTTFIYSDLRTEENRVFITVENAGDRAGDEIVQLYLGMQEGVIFRPKRELKGFVKVHLKPGEKREVCFKLTPEDFRFWKDGWKALSGAYQVYAGGGLHEQMLSEEITLSDAWFADSAQEQGPDAVQTANGMGGHVADALVLISNGHLFAGIRRMLSK